MPFTLAHPAAAVPLRRLFGRQAVLSALVIGSLTPDAVYFLPLRVSQPASHSLAGLAWFCVPVGLVAWLVFHLVLKVPVVALLPRWVQARLPPVRPGVPAVSPIVLVLALALGAATHVVWDAFTHAATLPARLFPWLRVHLGTVGGLDVPVWKLLQHASTAVGLGLLAGWSWRRLAAATPAAQPAVPAVAPGAKTAALVVLVAALGLAALAGVLQAPPSEWSLVGLRLPLRRAVVASLQAAGAATLALALCWRVAALARERASTTRPDRA
ncbi:MAG: DUF4184 family protein [bacterium]|nr:DUF4184 family protein [bacterium]